VNKLLAKEIIQKINKGRINNQVIAARKLLLGEIVLYIKDKEAYTRLKTNTTWAKVLSLQAQMKAKTYKVLLKL
jgi:hypothetical protein